jgi:hypothetical protein
MVAYFFESLAINLNIRGGPGDEGLGAAKDFVVFFRRDMIPSQPSDDRAVGKRKSSFPAGFYCYIVAQNGAQIIEVACFVGD